MYVLVRVQHKYFSLQHKFGRTARAGSSGSSHLRRSLECHHVAAAAFCPHTPSAVQPGGSVCRLSTAGRSDSPRNGGVGPELLAVCPAGRLLHPTGTAPAPLCHAEESSSSSSCNTTSLRLKTKPARRARCAQGTPAAPTSPWILCHRRQFQGTVKVSDFEQSPSFINSFLKFHS